MDGRGSFPLEANLVSYHVTGACGTLLPAIEGKVVQGTKKVLIMNGRGLSLKL